MGTMTLSVLPCPTGASTYTDCVWARSGMRTVRCTRPPNAPMVPIGQPVPPSQPARRSCHAVAQVDSPPSGRGVRANQARRRPPAARAVPTPPTPGEREHERTTPRVRYPLRTPPAAPAASTAPMAPPSMDQGESGPSVVCSHFIFLRSQPIIISGPMSGVCSGSVPRSRSRDRCRTSRRQICRPGASPCSG